MKIKKNGKIRKRMWILISIFVVLFVLVVGVSIYDLNQYTDEIIAKYKARMTASKIAEIYNTYSATVTRLLKNNEIEIRQRTKILSSFL